MNQVIDEMLRRTSISFSVFREAKEDVNINGQFFNHLYIFKLYHPFFILWLLKEIYLLVGYLVPKGWKVLVWNRGVHMDPETYANPKEFDPSRWDVNPKFYYLTILFLFLSVGYLHF